MSRRKDENRVEVTVYRITGRQLFFDVGRSVCEECDLAVAAVSRAVNELEGTAILFKVEPWLDRLPFALAKGAYHPPITLVDGRIVGQGVVPDVDQVKRAIAAAAERKGIRTKPPGPEQVDAEAPYARQGAVWRENPHH
ncbi:MAG: hypothetical protein KGI38_03865 [Thaumarchaeota archaeon]|nr:hypothetical protein [Nitrososphaerota archaeon]